MEHIRVQKVEIGSSAGAGPATERVTLKPQNGPQAELVDNPTLSALIEAGKLKAGDDLTQIKNPDGTFSIRNNSQNVTVTPNAKGGMTVTGPGMNVHAPPPRDTVVGDQIAVTDVSVSSPAGAGPPVTRVTIKAPGTGAAEMVDDPALVALSESGKLNKGDVLTQIHNADGTTTIRNNTQHVSARSDANGNFTVTGPGMQKAPEIKRDQVVAEHIKVEDVSSGGGAGGPSADFVRLKAPGAKAVTLMDQPGLADLIKAGKLKAGDDLTQINNADGTTTIRNNTQHVSARSDAKGDFTVSGPGLDQKGPVTDKTLSQYYQDVKVYEKLRATQPEGQQTSQLRDQIAREGQNIQNGEYQGKNPQLHDKAIKDVENMQHGHVPTVSREDLNTLARGVAAERVASAPARSPAPELAAR